MAHEYTKDGKLWGPTHPAWPKKADGTPYQRIPAKIREQMKAEGTWPDLYMSVTTYLQYCKGPALLNWKGRQAIDIAKQVFASLKDNQDYSALLEETYKEESNKPADDGKDIHKKIDAWLKTGVLPEDPIALNACNGIGRFLEDVGLADEAGEFEVGFADNIDGYKYGGTADAVYYGKALLDWKTTNGVKTNLPYPDQPAQCSAYITAIDPTIDVAYNVYINQEDGRVYGYCKYDDAALCNGWELFTLCYDLHNTMDAIAEQVKFTKV